MSSKINALLKEIRNGKSSVQRVEQCKREIQGAAPYYAILVHDTPVVVPICVFGKRETAEHAYWQAATRMEPLIADHVTYTKIRNSMRIVILAPSALWSSKLLLDTKTPSEAADIAKEKLLALHRDDIEKLSLKTTESI